VFDTDGVLTDTASVRAAAWKQLFDGYLEERAARLGELTVVSGEDRRDGR
jgi:beta-phosphoglucomutase-like phosphatase (HAD superfamily)